MEIRENCEGREIQNGEEGSPKAALSGTEEHMARPQKPNYRTPRRVFQDHESNDLRSCQKKERDGGGAELLAKCTVQVGCGQRPQRPEESQSLCGPSLLSG